MDFSRRLDALDRRTPCFFCSTIFASLCLHSLYPAGDVFLALPSCRQPPSYQDGVPPRRHLHSEPTSRHGSVVPKFTLRNVRLALMAHARQSSDSIQIRTPRKINQRLEMNNCCSDAIKVVDTDICCCALETKGWKKSSQYKSVRQPQKVCHTQQPSLSSAHDKLMTQDDQRSVGSTAQQR